MARSIKSERASAPSPAAISVDVEDWFQVENLRRAIPRETWKARELRVERNTDRILELMAASGVSATFFVLGWIAQRCPSLVERIGAEGHEIASHGYGHELVTTLTPDAFRSDVERSKSLLEDVTGTRIEGYRAPSFSITDWAIPILHDLGFAYDSSSFPTLAHDRYGKLTGIGRDESIVELRPGFYEACISCLGVGAFALPWGGGGYFRLIPYPVFRRGIMRILGAGRPYVFYIHPWEIDPGQPRVEDVAPIFRFRHYAGLERCENRFASLLADFQWSTVSELVEASGDGRR
ncbi:MAG: DUF3473 domain-containing protein [Actinomycetota bacterium]|nr:DUF3473 domain-containing protein [Actinomycetota bacterium]